MLCCAVALLSAVSADVNALPQQEAAAGAGKGAAAPMGHTPTRHPVSSWVHRHREGVGPGGGGGCKVLEQQLGTCTGVQLQEQETAQLPPLGSSIPQQQGGGGRGGLSWEEHSPGCVNCFNSSSLVAACICSSSGVRVVRVVQVVLPSSVNHPHDILSGTAAGSGALVGTPR